ncbi:DUF998 domain-containing protein [Brachybacterium sp. YJGR34]|uniref:DUF998 domain-containing protein n=1 Tax=Brachybacterium sp. YJGR34 TaxID=2059911 RepID=UPI000E0A1EA7|nr:DUF998 domain-containing protein [Brachybacterium sp. YJGR34]
MSTTGESPSGRVVPSPRPYLAVRTESLTLVLGLGGVLVGLVLGLVALPSAAGLTGPGSIGQIAALSSAATSVLAAAAGLALLAPRHQSWMLEMPRWRRAVAMIGPVLVCAALAYLLTSALYTVLQQAFWGVTLDRVTGTLWVAATSGVWAYVVAAAVAALNSRSLASLILVFLSIGVLASAIQSPDPYWWESYFSELGETGDRSSALFNLTLLLTGIAFLTVGDLIAHDLGRWAGVAGEPRWKVQVVRWTLVALGLNLALIGLISRNVSVPWHNRVSMLLVVVFGLALIVFPVILRRLPGALIAVTAAAFAVLVVVIVLFEPVGYLNMTAFEFGAALTVYAWLLLFIRQVSAAAEGARTLEESAPAS